MVSLRSIGVIAALPAVLLMGCSKSDSASTTTTTSADQAYCDDVASLKTDLGALASLDVISQGTEALKQQVTKVEDDLTALKSSAKGSAATQIDEFDSSLTDLKSSIDKLGSGDLTLANAGETLTAVSTTVTSGQAVYTQLSTACK
jgi:hypothetical protein